MQLYTLFDTCIPRGDILHGTLTESDFAADLAQICQYTSNERSEIAPVECSLPLI